MSEKDEPNPVEAPIGDQPEVEKLPATVGTDEEIEQLARRKSRRSFIIGGIGLDEGFDQATWKLRVEGLAAQTGAGDGAVELTLDDIKRLPRVEMVTLLKCIEGWADMGHWVGARFADFAAAYQPAARRGESPGVPSKPEDLVRYVSLETPGRGYYVGLDVASALHPQTLLVYEMDGQPLTPEHGAPLRLFTPIKYGIKSLKRIGTIRFSDERPADFWAERGYDWYAGH